MRRVFVVSTLAAALMACAWAPTAAASRTRWVDDDGKAGLAGCAARGRAYRTIQSAVDASGPGDTIKVCPGTYREYVTAVYKDDLRIVSVRRHQAVLRGSVGFTFRFSYGARLKGFKLVIPSTRRKGGECRYGGGITLNASVARIEDNVITNQGTHTRSCGGGGIGMAGISSATILRNTIIDGTGITGAGARNTTIRFNRLLSHHKRDRSSGIRGGGIVFGVSRGMVIEGNTIEGPPRATNPGDMPADGIRLGGESEGAIVGNRIRHVVDGITAPDHAWGDVIDNDVRYGTGTGIVAYWPARIEGNLVRGFAGPGISVARNGRGAIVGNDFRHNDADGIIDCVQAPQEPQNTDEPTVWTGNRGDGSDPEGICTPKG